MKVIVHWLTKSMCQDYVSLRQSLMVLSFSSAADAMMFSEGWHVVHRTTSVWPWSFCTISLVWRFQMYTMLSSDPDTIHYGCKHFKFSNDKFSKMRIPFHQSRKSWQIYSISHSCGQCRSSDIFLYCSPTIWECCPKWQPKCTFHLGRISQTRQVDCRRLWAFSNTGQKQCPKYGCKCIIGLQ